MAYWAQASRLPGLVQVGTDIVGTFHGAGFYTDGFVPAGPDTGTPFGRYDFPKALYFVGARNAIDGTYSYVDKTRSSGLTRAKLRLLKDAHTKIGEYRLTYAYAGKRKRTFEGEFGMKRDGAVTFRDRRGRVVQRGTLLGVGRPCAISGTCRSGEAPGDRDVWLILSGPKGNHPDGGRLQRVR